MAFLLIVWMKLELNVIVSSLGQLLTSSGGSSCRPVLTHLHSDRKKKTHYTTRLFFIVPWWIDVRDLEQLW